MAGHDLHADGRAIRCRRCGTLADGFSSHWAAVAAMIRLSGDPDFRSLGDEKDADLAIEDTVPRECCGDG